MWMSEIEVDLFGCAVRADLRTTTLSKNCLSRLKSFECKDPVTSEHLKILMEMGYDTVPENDGEACRLIYRLDGSRRPHAKNVKRDPNAWRSEMPTPKQIKFLETLGVQKIPQNKGDAAHMIYEAKLGRQYGYRKLKP